MSTTSPRKAESDAWVRSVASKHLGANIRQYSWRTYIAEKSVATSFGFQLDISPMEGKIVDENDTFVLMKVSAKEFFVALKSALSMVPEVGSKCKITPYARKRFDGERLDKPEVVHENGFTSTRMILGEYRSYLPIDKKTIVCPEFKDMIEVIEDEKADDVRTIAQVMIDAGALKEPVFFQDVTDPEQIIDKPPTVRFRVSTQKFDGYLSILYDRAMDSFTIVLLDPQLNEIAKDEYQFITLEGNSTLGQKIIELIDDGQWKIAPVEVLKKAPRQRAEAAA
ncbi:hypothetical protein [Ottowia sp.]|uniref:hypothetical protein n=1 Tax=Ottowia sp. TaxID=1898956 RepID=UPI0026008F95|nr:hypothetical protein [Ottowia sp.]MBK6616151.1 hypothetical protein [Ottowia sp.]